MGRPPASCAYPPSARPISASVSLKQRSAPSKFILRFPKDFTRINFILLASGV